MTWNNYILSSLVQVGCIAGYGSSVFLMPLMKRKTQYISAAIMMAITQVILGFALIADVRTYSVLSILKNVHSFLFSQNFENEMFKEISRIIMPLCVILVFVFYGLGVGPVTFALLGEVLPLKVKSVATSIILFIK